MSNEPLRYDQIRQKSIHNAFQRREGIYDQVFYWRARSLEVDIRKEKHVSGRKGGGGKGKKIPSGFPKLDGDWYVYHETWDVDSTVEHLSGFLRLLRGVHRVTPKHEVVTVFLDMKDDFHKTANASQSGKRLDGLLTHEIGEANLFRPTDLVEAGRTRWDEDEDAREGPEPTTLRAAAACGWPDLADMRGKFLFVLTGSEGNVRSYLGGKSATERMAFLSAKLGAKGPVSKADDVVFFNMNGKDVKRAADVPPGCVSRAYYVNDQATWRAAVKHGCNHIATDKVNAREDPWARTADDDTGYPFESREAGAKLTSAEECHVGAVWAWSDDLWEGSDSFYFHFADCAQRMHNRYDFCIVGPNSHCEDWMKGGVVARASLRPDAPYFGVFRIGQNQPLRVQFRLVEGGRTMSKSLDPQDGFDDDTLPFVRLRISQAGGRAAAWGSVDGSKSNWLEILTQDFEEPLRYQGICVSAHEDVRGAKFLFAVPAGAPSPGFDSKRLVGPNRGGAFRGGVDWDGPLRWKVRDFG